MDFLRAESIDVIITSPPYNLGAESWPMGGESADGMGERTPREDGIGYKDSMTEETYQKWQLACLEEMYRVAKRRASLFYNHKVRQRGGSVMHPLQWISRSSWTIRQEIIWDRTSTHNHCAQLFWPVDERIYWLTKGNPVLPDRPIGMPTVWRFFGPVPNTWHPAPFCEELPQRCLQAIGRSGIVVLDPFGGSMTTCRVAQKFGYESIGVDMEHSYIDQARTMYGWEAQDDRG